MRIKLNKKLPLNWGYIVSFAVVSIPAYGWMAGFDFSSLSAWESVAITIAKVAAFGGLTLMALVLIMSGRYMFCRRLFGGMDKMYSAHQYFGVLALLLILLHPFALTAMMWPGSPGQALGMWVDPARGAGPLALYLLIALVLWSLLTKAKYETFVKIHRFLGLVFVLSVIHAFTAGSVLASNTFIYWYIFILSALAIFTFVQYSLIGDIFHRPIKYKVSGVINCGDNTTEVTLEPMQRAARFHPGQFVYVRFNQLKSHGYHPFSITSGKHDHRLQLVMRHVGDFTNAVDGLKTGSVAKVRGPFGMFILDRSFYKKQLWIAGGIGVAPFLSGARSKIRAYNKCQIEMVYATRDDCPYGADELQKIRENDPGFNLQVFPESKFGHVSLKTLKENMSDFDERDIYICGPPVMLNSLIKEAKSMGIKNRLHYEEFSY